MGLGILSVVSMIPIGYLARKADIGEKLKTAITIGTAATAPFVMETGWSNEEVKSFESPVARTVFALILIAAYTAGERMARPTLQKVE